MEQSVRDDLYLTYLFAQMVFTMRVTNGDLLQRIARILIVKNIFIYRIIWNRVNSAIFIVFR